jgi:purine-binding chemotaxis protein CheW
METGRVAETEKETLNIEKTGRKVLFAGVPCKPLTSTSEPVPVDSAMILKVEDLLEKGLKGDFSDRIDEGQINDQWRPLVQVVNNLNRKMEEERKEITRLRKLEDNAHEFSKINAEYELRLSSLNRMRESIFQKNPMPLLLLDNSQRINDANEAFSRVSGIPPESLKSMKFQDFNIISLKGGGISEVLKFKQHNVSDIAVEFPSGQHTFEQYSIPMFSENGEVSGIMVVFYDKTVSIKEEDRLRRELKELQSHLEEEIKTQKTSGPEIKSAAISSPPAPASSLQDKDAKDPKGMKSKIKIRTFDVVEFELCGEKYALDINIAREIVEMMPITPIPCSPDYLRGIMNLRGEITNIINITGILGLPPRSEDTGNKIIVLSAEATGGENIGIIVDDVQSVIQVQETDVEHLGEGLSSQSSGHIKGIIKIGSKIADKKGEREGEKDLVIWIDMLKVIGDLTQQKSR